MNMRYSTEEEIADEYIKWLRSDGSKGFYAYEPYLSYFNLTEKEKTELANLFYRIVTLYRDKCFKIDFDKVAKNGEVDKDWLEEQIEIRNNVDEAILQVIKENDKVLFLRCNSTSLWKFLAGNEYDMTYLPKTMEYIIKHEKAAYVLSTRDLNGIKTVNIAWGNTMSGHFNPHAVMLCIENPKFRTSIFDPMHEMNIGYGTKERNLGMQALKLIDFGYYDLDNNKRRELNNAWLDVVDKCLDYEDCSIQLCCRGVTPLGKKLYYNIGFCCANRANVLIKEYIEQVELCIKYNNSDLYPEVNLEELEQVICRLRDLAYKSMLNYPKTATQRVGNNTTLDREYVDLKFNMKYLKNPEQYKIDVDAEKKEKLRKENTKEAFVKRLTR